MRQVHHLNTGATRPYWNNERMFMILSENHLAIILFSTTNTENRIKKKQHYYYYYYNNNEDIFYFNHNIWSSDTIKLGHKNTSYSFDSCLFLCWLQNNFSSVLWAFVVSSIVSCARS